MDESGDELNQVFASLVAFARQSDELRSLLVKLGKALICLDGSATEQPVSPKLSDVPEQIPIETPPIVVPPTAPVEPRSMLEPAIVLPPKPAIPPLVDEDLPQASAKFEVKADGCDWHVKRRQLLDRGADFQFDIAPQDKLIMDRARIAGGSWMWMCRPESPTPELSLMQVVAECYRNSARATRLVVQIRGKYSPASQEYTAALNLLAESLSALRAAITDIDEYVDPDQNAMFLWLRSETFSSSVFVERHMRLDDPANPQDWLDLQTRLNQLESRIEQTAIRRKRGRNAVNSASSVSSSTILGVCLRTANAVPHCGQKLLCMSSTRQRTQRAFMMRLRLADGMPEPCGPHVGSDERVQAIPA